MLSREELQKAIRGPIAIVNVPEWGGDVGIRRLSAADLIRLREIVPAETEGAEAVQRTPEEDLAATCELLAMALCDESGERIFSAAELREWDGQQSDVLHRLIVETQRHNGIGAEAAEEREKNSEGGQTSDST